eukprot:756850-Hanusia_phi.AAC.1
MQIDNRIQEDSAMAKRMQVGSRRKGASDIGEQEEASKQLEAKAQEVIDMAMMEAKSLVEE